MKFKLTVTLQPIKYFGFVSNYKIQIIRNVSKLIISTLKRHTILKWLVSVLQVIVTESLVMESLYIFGEMYQLRLIINTAYIFLLIHQ